MTEESKQLVEKALTDLLAWARDAGSLAQEQAPHIVHEIVLWGTVEHGLYTLFGLGMLVGAAVVVMRLVKNFSQWDRDDNGGAILGSGVFSLIFGVLGTIIFFASLSPFLKVFFAPRLYLIEYLRHLV